MAADDLRVTEGEDRGRRLSVDAELLIGRTATEGLGDDPELSRHHARITREESGRLPIEDLGSANGTFLNGQPVHGRTPLEPGDSIRIGSTTLQLVAAGRNPTAPAPVRRPPPPTPAAP